MYFSQVFVAGRVGEEIMDGLNIIVDSTTGLLMEINKTDNNK